MTRPVTGIIPVMLTPFTGDGAIDWDAYAKLVEWYLDHGADALFAVCQSSEMAELTIAERAELARFTVEAVAGRVPIVAAGHVADRFEDQVVELRAVAETGIDALVLVTNRLAPDPAADDAAVTAGMKRLMAALPADLPLGLYECPAPHRRLLSDDQIRFCADSGRFVFFKDVSCDLATVARRAKIAEGSPLAVVNANAAIAWPAMQRGSRGFCGVFTNFCPDLYCWLYRHGAAHPKLAHELATFLATAAMSEFLGYPLIAKVHHLRLGTFATARSRAAPYDLHERVWALDETLERIEEGIRLFRTKVNRIAVEEPATRQAG